MILEFFSVPVRTLTEAAGDVEVYLRGMSLLYILEICCRTWYRSMTEHSLNRSWMSFSLKNLRASMVIVMPFNVFGITDQGSSPDLPHGVQPLSRRCGLTVRRGMKSHRSGASWEYICGDGIFRFLSRTTRYHTYQLKNTVNVFYFVGFYFFVVFVRRLIHWHEN